MSMLRRREPNEFVPLDRVMSRLFNDPFLAGLPAADSEEGTLALDVSEDESNVIVRASLPGFKKDDVEIELHDNVLTIKAEQSEESEEKHERYYRRERSYGSVSRRVALPSSVIDDEAKAELKDGVLTVRVPKTKAETPKKVKVG